MQLTIRKAKKEDMSGVHALICELAAFEKAPHEVTNTIEALEQDGFGDQPVFNCLVAEENNSIVGMALYFIKYSTWKGKGIYLDDIVVTESMRGKGIGKKLFDLLIKEAVAMNAQQLHWQVLDWNEPAIKFYEKYNAEMDTEWINCKLSRQQFENLKIR